MVVVPAAVLLSCAVVCLAHPYRGQSLSQFVRYRCFSAKMSPYVSPPELGGLSQFKLAKINLEFIYWYKLVS